MKRRRLVLLPGAQSDLAAIREELPFARKRTGRLLAAFRKWGRQVRAFPNSAEEWEGGRRIATVRTHRVVYRVTPTAILVVGVVDSRAAEQLRRLARRDG